MTEPEEDDYISKSQVKREMHSLLKLGKQLTELPDSVRQRYELPELLEEAIVDFRRFKSNIARKRQLQYIGKVMRDTDTSIIEGMIRQSKLQVEIDKRHFQQIEQLRDDLIANKPDILNNLIGDHPNLDIQHIRQMIRASQKEAKENKPTASSRKLFQYLRELGPVKTN